jgi:hypothetical protein
MTDTRRSKSVKELLKKDLCKWCSSCATEMLDCDYLHNQRSYGVLPFRKFQRYIFFEGCPEWQQLFCEGLPVNRGYLFPLASDGKRGHVTIRRMNRNKKINCVAATRSKLAQKSCRNILRHHHDTLKDDPDHLPTKFIAEMTGCSCNRVNRITGNRPSYMEYPQDAENQFKKDSNRLSPKFIKHISGPTFQDPGLSVDIDAVKEYIKNLNLKKYTKPKDFKESVYEFFGIETKEDTK